MDYLLDRLAPSHIVAVISVVCGCTVALAMIVAITKYQFQSLADDTTLRREKQQAELELKQKLAARGVASPSLDTLLKPDGPAVEEDDGTVLMNAELAKRFGALDLPADEIEDALRRAMAADATRKAAIIEIMDTLVDEVKPAAILAAVRPLCGGPAGAKAGAC
ncbi:MAG: hypothetical protein C0501_14940 [Isosphaera sp.]|nr:hypothetical protein [Isosphaera sp.]